MVTTTYLPCQHITIYAACLTQKWWHSHQAGGGRNTPIEAAGELSSTVRTWCQHYTYFTKRENILPKAGGDYTDDMHSRGAPRNIEPSRTNGGRHLIRNSERRSAAFYGIRFYLREPICVDAFKTRAFIFDDWTRPTVSRPISR